MSRRSFIHSIIFVIQQKDETASPRGFYASPLSPMLLHLLTYAVSLSLLVSYVPKQRKIATIQLVTKIKNPTTLWYFRPISVLPIVERFSVQKFIYPTFSASPLDELLNPHRSIRLLAFSFHYSCCNLHTPPHYRTPQDQHQCHTYLAWLFQGFSKTPSAILPWLPSSLMLTYFIYNRIVEFLKDRSHTTRFTGLV